jgi:hypothetical protein
VKGDALRSVFVRVLDEHVPEPGLLVAKCRCGAEWSSDHGSVMLLNAYRAVDASVDGNEPGKSHRDARDTEAAAAARIEVRSGTQRAAVFEALRVEPQTDDELQQLLGMNGNTERPRRVELVDRGLVEDSGQRRENAIVWVLSEEGRAYRVSGAQS